MANLTRIIAVVASTAAAGLGGAVIAGAADHASTTPTTPSQLGYGHGAKDGPGDRRFAGGRRGHGGGSHANLAAVAKSLGLTEAKLRSAVEAARPDKPSRDNRGHRGDDAAAIAKSLGESTADVQAVLDAARKAHDAARTAKQAEMFAALAKSLGKDAADVKRAFEANRPGAPTPTTR